VGVQDEDNIIVIDLREIFRIIKKRLLIIIFIPLLAVLVSGIISFFVLKPVYESYSTLLVAKTYQGDQAYMLQYNDILMANQLVKTYSELARSRTVAEQVIKREALEMTPEEFSEMIEVKPFKDTQLIQITIKNQDPELAARLANSEARVFTEKVVEIMKVDNVNIIDVAEVPTDPVKPNKKLNIAIAGVLGIMAALGLVFLLELLDQTIKTTDDITRQLKLPVLGTVPVFDDEN